MFVRFRLGAGLMLVALALLNGPEAVAKIPRALRSKVFYAPKVEDSGLKPLLKQFRKAKPKATVPRGKDKHWKGVLVAFFSKKSHAGPLTIWIFDASDKDALRRNEATFATSANRKERARYFVWDMDLDPNDGLNKGRTYWVKIGQIIGKRTRIYAKGKLTLGK